MAKRFIDTTIFDDPWFMDLSKDGKIMWIYLITKCDHAGIIDINSKLLQFQTGIDNYNKTKKEIGDRLVFIRETYHFIPKFIEYQYPGFPKSSVKQQQGAVKILTEFGLYDPKRRTLINTDQRLSKDLPKTYDNGNGNDNVYANDNVNEYGIPIK